MHFHPNLHAHAGRIVATLAQGGGDVLDGLFAGDALGKAIRPHFDGPRACIVGQVNPCLRDLDVLLPHRRVSRVELARRTEAEQAHVAPGKARFHLLPLRLGEAGLHPVFMLRTKFYGGKASLLEFGDQGLQVPVPQDVIGDGAQLKHTGYSSSPGFVTLKVGEDDRNIAGDAPVGFRCRHHAA